MILQISPDAPFLIHAAAATALVLHVGGGTVAIISGATAIVARKGQRLHKVAGTVFFVSMLTMATIAAIVAPMLPTARWTNTTAAVFTLYLVATAWATVRRRPGEVGGFERVAVLVPLGMVALGLALGWVGVQTGKTGSYMTVYVFAGIAALAAICDLRMIRHGGISGAHRIARHLWRMSLALFVATGSFFFGQQEFLPAAIRETFVPAVPALAPLALMIFWLFRVKFARAFKARSAAA